MVEGWLLLCNAGVVAVSVIILLSPPYAFLPLFSLSKLGRLLISSHHLFVYIKAQVDSRYSRFTLNCAIRLELQSLNRVMVNMGSMGDMMFTVTIVPNIFWT